MGNVRGLIHRAAVVCTTTALIVGAGATPSLAAPPHRISISDVTLAEGNSGSTMAAFTISYTGPNNASTIDWAAYDQTATAGADYTTSSGTASLPSGGCKCATVNVPVLGDAVDESDETFVVNLSNPSAGTIDDGQGVGWIQDDDGTPTISVPDASAAEDSGPLTFTVALSNASASTVTVDYATSDGSASAGNDYAAASGTLTFVAGDTTESVNVTLSNDLLAEGDEDLGLTLSTPSGVVLADGSAVGTITDDDAPPTLSIDDISIAEGDAGTTPRTFTVSLSKPHVSPVSVDYSSVDGLAIEGADYDAASGTLTFAPGDMTDSVDIDVVGDLLAEDEETFDVSLSNASGATIADAVGTATIQDDDPDPALSVDDVTVDEGGTATFTVALDAPAGRNVDVDYVTSDGTALHGSDFTDASGTLTFAPGEVETSLAIDTLSDTSYEPSEAFTVELADAANASIADASGEATVNDDDAAPTFSVDDVSVDEADGIATFTITKTGDTALDASVNVATVDGSATAGEDHHAMSATLVFGSAETSLEVDVALTDDAVYEGAETFYVALADPVDAAVDDDIGVATIADDEVAPTLSIDDVTVTEGDSGDVSADFTISLAGATATEASVDYAVVVATATAGDDVDAVASTAVIPAGEASVSVSVPVHGDVTFETNETFSVELSNAVAASVSDGHGDAVISDDDAMPSIAIDDVTIIEGDAGTSSAIFTVTRTGPTQLPVTFDWATADGTALAGSDYLGGSGNRSISITGSSGTISVDVIGDTLDEPEETFSLSIADAGNATITNDTGVATIGDDDAAVASLTLKARKTARGVQVRGLLEPASSSSEVVILMQEKVGSRWKKVARQAVGVTQLGDRDGDGATDAAYRGVFTRPAAGRYRLVVTAAATADATAARSTRNLRI